MSNGDQAANFLYLVLLLVLVGSALAARRLPIGRTLQMAGAWVLIFAAAFVVFALKDDFAALGSRLYGELGGTSGVEEAGGTLRIRQSEDGHFWVAARLNGEEVRFLIDSGATTTSISADTARRAHIEPSGGFPVLVDTANGSVSAQRGRADRLEVGPIERRDVAVHIAEAFGETDVLGMNFLSSLSSWGVEGQWLVLKP